MCVYKDPVHISQRTQSVRKMSQLMVFREIMAVYCEAIIKHTATLSDQTAEFFLSNLITQCNQ
jgi:hypothetical protein